MNRMGSTEQILFGAAVLVACLAPLASGCHFRWGWSVLVFSSAVLLLLSIDGLRKKKHPLPPLSFFFLALLGLHFIQAIPLPPYLLEWLAPIQLKFLPAHLDKGTWRSLSANLEATRDNALILCACYAAFVTGWLVLNRRSRLKVFGFAFLTIGVVLTMYGLWVIIAHPPEKLFGVPNYGKDRMAATYTNANKFAGLLELILGLGMASIVLSATQAEKSSKRIFQRIRSGMAGRRSILYVILFLMWVTGLVGLFLTQSRMGIAAFLLSAGLAAVIVYRNKLNTGALLIILTLMAFSFLAGLSLALDAALDRYADLANPNAKPLTRMLLWSHSWDLIKDHGVLGGGSGAYRTLFRYYQPAGLDRYAKFAHNDYINALADLGLVGLLIILGGLGFWFARIRDLLKGLPNGTRKLTVFAILWSILSILLHSLTDSNLQEPANAWLFCLLLGAGMGLAQAHAGPSKNEEASNYSAGVWAHRGRLSPHIGLSLLMLFGGGAVFLADMTVPESAVILLRAQGRKNPETALATCDKALSIDPLWTEGHLLKARILNDTVASEPDATLKDKRLEQAEKAAHQALRLSPLEVGAWYQLARSALTRNDYGPAHSRMEKALRASPYHPDLGLTYAKVALFQWQKAGRPGHLVPDNILRVLKQYLQNKPGDLNKALNVLYATTPFESRWQSLAPETPESTGVLCRFLLAHGYKPEALAAAQKGLRLIDRNTSPDRLSEKKRILFLEMELALLLGGLGQKAKAQERMASIFSACPKSLLSELTHRLQYLLRKYKFKDKGWAWAHAIMKNFPNETWSLNLTGTIALTRKDYSAAASLFEQSLKIEDHGMAHFQLAAALWGLRQSDLALLEMDRAVALEPTNGDFRFRLANYLFAKGYFERAALAVEETEHLKPALFERCQQLRSKIERAVIKKAKAAGN